MVDDFSDNRKCTSFFLGFFEWVFHYFYVEKFCSCFFICSCNFQILNSIGRKKTHLFVTIILLAEDGKELLKLPKVKLIQNEKREGKV